MLLKHLSFDNLLILRINFLSITEFTKVIDMAQENPTLEQTIEKTMEKTDFGHLVNSNKNIILGLGAVILIAILGYSFFQHKQDEGRKNTLTEVYVLQSTVISSYKEKKSNANEFLKSLSSKTADIKNHIALLPEYLNISDQLIKDGKEEAVIDIFLGMYKDAAPNSYAAFLIGNHLTTTYENMGKDEKALEIANDLVKSSLDVMKPHSYLNLGRLQKKSGQDDNSKVSFKHIVDKYPDSEEAKLAKLYLEGI